jgi:hypothetical protein
MHKFLVTAAPAALIALAAPNPVLAQSAGSVERKSFSIDVSSWDRRGGLIAANVNDAGQRDLIITQPSRIIAYAQTGTKLWSVANPSIQLSGQSESDGLPGLHGAGRAESDDMWVMDRAGNKIADYDFDTAKEPQSWTDGGIEVIFPIHWTGGSKQLNAAKERHVADDVGIFDPLTAKFIRVFDETAARVYVADLAGDWREELVVISGSKLTIYRNLDENPNPGRASLWSTPCTVGSR